VYEAIHIAGPKHEAATKLKRVFADALLAMAGSFGALAGSGVVAAQQMQHRRLLQICRTVSFPVLINQQGELDARFFAELPGVVRIAKPDGRETSSFIEKFLLVFAQLRDVLAAKESAVMTEKNDDGRPISPQCAELNRLALGIGQRDSRKTAADRVFHKGHC
jgi:hypothetical protein